MKKPITSNLTTWCSDYQSVTVQVMAKTDPKHYKKFGKRVSELRKAAGLTQEQLAEKADMSYDTITSIEHGQQFATLGNLHRLAKALRVQAMELLRNQ